MQEEELVLRTVSCVKSKDSSYSVCYSAPEEAQKHLERMTETITENRKAWDLIVSGDRSYGRDGIEHMAIDRAEGHMGPPYAEDNFNKEYSRLLYVLERKKYDLELAKRLE